MNLSELRQALEANPGCGLRLVVGDGRAIADHFHVTEVGHVEKRFVDCGGVRRASVACVLQTLVAHDVDHRLTTDKLAKIVALADSLDLPGDAPVEVEHQERSVSVDAVAGCHLEDGAAGPMLVFQLTPKQTACLAEDACGLGLNVINEGDCCGSTGCC